jgi:membrane-anchored protein YejM (alkaline phosphatase superfamily)
MKKNHFDISFYNTGSSSPLTHYLPKEKEVLADEIGPHLNKRDELTMVNPLFMQLFVEGGTITEKDSKIKTVIELLIHHQQIENTIIIITGASTDQVKTPLVVIWPNKKHDTISKLTSHYDIFPSIILEDWKCKNRASDLSFGRNMFSKDVAEVHVAGNYNNLNIVDTKAQTITSISYYEGVEVRSLGSMNLENDKRDIVNIMAVLKDLTTFYKHR